MKSNILVRYMKSDYKEDDFGRGRGNAKRQRRRHIKRVAKRLFEKDFKENY